MHEPRGVGVDQLCPTSFNVLTQTDQRSAGVGSPCCLLLRTIRREDCVGELETADFGNCMPGYYHTRSSECRCRKIIQRQGKLTGSETREISARSRAKTRTTVMCEAHTIDQLCYWTPGRCHTTGWVEAHRLLSDSTLLHRGVVP